MSKDEIIFADGFSFRRNENAPDFVIGNVSIKVDDAVPFVKKHANADGWVNLAILVGKQNGKPYFKLDTFNPDPSKAKATILDEGEDDDMPF